MSKKRLRETLAVLGVIASLLFVAYEIRQNTIAARAAAYQSIGIATASAFDSAARDARWLAIEQKSAGEMDATDWTLFTLHVTMFARLGETVLLQVDQGLLPPDAMERLGYRGWKTIYQSEKWGCAWLRVREGVSDAFRDYVEGAQDQIGIDCERYEIPGL